jgi:WhiB family redox-sensing transcriptional regulator
MIDPEKVVDALCTQTDPEIFFPETGQNNTVAKSICAQCPISLDCLNDALLITQVDDFGIWGGTSAQERVVLRRQPATLENLRGILKERDAENRKALNLTIVRGR